MLKRAPFLVILFAALVLVVSVWAGTTGKISGNIVDKDTDEPLIGVNVQVFDDSGNLLGGAATDFDGNYFILNIRPGIYKVKASYVGYNSVTQTSVVVSSDRTAKVDFKLEQSVIKSEEIVITSKRKQVELDVTSSTSTTTSGQIENMPVSDVADILQMPVLSAFLDVKSDELQDLAVDTILRFSATRTLAAAMGATGAGVAELGANEMAEGLTRLAVAEGMAIRSDELAEVGAELVAEGLVETAAAAGLREAAGDLAAEGIAEIAVGAEELGEAAVEADVAETLEGAAEEA